MAHAFNMYQVDLLHAARAHVFYNVSICFIEAVEKAKSEEPSLYPILKKLCDLFVLDKLSDEIATLSECRFVNSAQIKLLRETVSELCVEIRPEAVALVDAFNYSDAVLGSFIGRADGDVYDKYLRKVMYNVVESKRITPYYNSEIKPFLQGEDHITNDSDTED